MAEVENERLQSQPPKTPGGDFGIFNNPIIIPDQRIGSYHSDVVVNLAPIAASAAQINLPVYDSAPLSVEMPAVAASDPKDESGAEKLTKKQLERIEKQKQREVERLERERKKEEEKRLKKEEKERKDKERQAKREQLEKEKERKREEERLKKEEKKKKLEEEKKRKDEEKRLKEEEKRQKEEEKRQKDEEKQRKEDRNQMKISSFFNIKPVTAKPADRPATPKHEKLEPNEKEETLLYKRQFLPFFIKQNVTMAPNGQLLPEQLSASISAFDLGLKSGVKATLEVLIPKLENAPPVSYTSSEKLLEALNSSTTKEKTLHQLVGNLPPIKYLQFYENSKPPYIGTWCSEKHLNTHITAANPLETSLTNYDYNYDSDLDWQDGDDDEGEDIDELEEGEDDEDDANEDDDMEDFVDNNDTTRRRVPVGNLLSTSRWNSNSEEDKQFFDEVKYERLEFDIQFPIDPYRDYWHSAKITVAAKEQVVAGTGISTPVKAAQNGNTTPNVLTPLKPSIKDAKVVAELIKFVEKNSDFTIGTLSELAKKEFKTYTKSMLKHTIQEVASYNKKKSVWEIKS